MTVDMDTVSIRDLVDPKTLNYGGNTLTDKLAKKALMLSKNDDLRISVLKKNAFKDMKEKGLVRKARKTGDLSLDFTLPNGMPRCHLALSIHSLPQLLARW